MHSCCVVDGIIIHLFSPKQPKKTCFFFCCKTPMFNKVTQKCTLLKVQLLEDFYIGLNAEICGHSGFFNAIP